MENNKKSIIRKKPKFFRRDWNKKIKLGSTVKKNRKWRGAKGRQNKIRLNRKGYSGRPKIGWGNNSSLKGLLNGLEAVRIENLKDLENIGKRQGIVIGRVGKKKRELIISKAKEMKVRILNRYRVAKR
jgi:ribosomal protein L32E|tara:strand:+ start:1310 stop:1693 length:384 start_codon:yes stop_codon:yes gene_type:complete